MANLEEIQKQNEEVLKTMENQTEENPQEIIPEDPEQKAKADALKARIVELQEKIKSYIDDLLTTDFTADEAGYAADLFTAWLKIKTHGTIEHEDLLKAIKEANDKYLGTKLCDLTPVPNENTEEITS